MPNHYMPDWITDLVRTAVNAPEPKHPFRECDPDSISRVEHFALLGRVGDLAHLARRYLHGRQLDVFETHVIARLRDPAAPRPSIKDTASRWRVKEKRIYKDIAKAGAILTREWRLQQELLSAAKATIMVERFDAKRDRTGGRTYLSDGRDFQRTEATGYATSVNSVRETTGYADENKDEIR